MQRNVRDANRIRDATLVILQPGTFSPKRVTSAFPVGGIARRVRVTPGALPLAGGKAFDGALHSLAPLEHNEMARDSDVRLFRSRDGGRDLLKTSALEDEVAVPSDDKRGHLQLAEYFPSIPF